MKIHPSKSAMLVRSVLLMVGIIIMSTSECDVKPMGPGGDGDKPVTFAYICTNGTVAEGTTGTENTEKCSACETGFVLSSVKQCVVPGDETPPAVVTLTASLPSPSVGTVQLDWREPADADFSHLLISWTPATAGSPIQVNKGTRTTVIPASGLTSGTAYTFTAISVDATGNMSAASTGATATPVFSCDSPLFATTTGGPYAPQPNVASGSGTTSDPYLIPLVDGVPTTCPIVIDFDHSGEDITGGTEYFRITNMPTGASYASSTLAWDFKDAALSTDSVSLNLREDGATPGPADDKEIAYTSNGKGARICGDANNESCAMNTQIGEVAIMPTGARTVAFVIYNLALTDSVTFTLTP